jgi:mannose-6-phosphate isomerase
MSNLMPVKLNPTFKDYLWGGTRLKEEFGKTCDLERVAESWELSAHKDGESVAVLDGREYKFTEYISLAGVDALGENCKKYDYFPLLIKLIDAKGDLSVQVHPSDDYALKNEGEYGKTEMWYVLDCDDDAALYYGFKETVSREEYENAIKENRLCDILRRIKVKKGDVFFIPAGTVHAIGAGMLICEVQQNSNTTYRVYDYGRRDKDGNTRQLHIEKALEVSTLSRAPELPVIGEGDGAMLCSCEYFSVSRRRIAGEGRVTVAKDSFVSLIVTSGYGELIFGGGKIDFVKGDSIFIPAQSVCMEIKGECELIEARVN